MDAALKHELNSSINRSPQSQHFEQKTSNLPVDFEESLANVPLPKEINSLRSRLLLTLKDVWAGFP